jgi:hypothetical protein
VSRRKLIVLSAARGVEVLWVPQDDDLIVKLADDLDEVTRQRYIAEAKRATGFKDRRGVLPLGVGVGAAEGARRGVRQQSIIALTAGAAVTGIAAAVILPVVLSNGHHASHRPSAAAPAPTQQPAHPERPPALPKPPRRAVAIPAHGGSTTSPAISLPTPPVSVTPTLPAHAVPIGLHPALPSVPMPLPHPVTPAIPVLPKLPLTVRPVTQSFCVRLHIVSLQVRLACNP